MGKAVGVGGVFFKAKDPAGLLAWYAQNLGIPLSAEGYTSFEGPDAQGVTAFAFFPEDSGYFGESGQRAMINFRVDSLDEVLERLAAGGARIDPKQDSYSFGRFAWFWDPEGNRVELWEPGTEPEAGESAG
jgi:predicted enzyme related to lactoylglutathione lyase